MKSMISLSSSTMRNQIPRTRENLCVLLIFLAQMLAQLADGLVFLVADALGGEIEFLGHFLNGPAVETHLQDALLAWA